jgi:hypothetical protein
MAAAWMDAVIQLAGYVLSIKMCKELEDRMWQTRIFSILQAALIVIIRYVLY